LEHSPSLSPHPGALLGRRTRAFRPSPIEGIALALILVAASYVGYTLYAGATGLNEEPPPPPTYATATRTTLTATVSASGSVESSQQVELSFSSAGRVQEVFVGVGDEVTSGQGLAKLDDTDLAQALRSAESSLASVQANYEAALRGSSAAEIASGEQSVASARSQVINAQQNLDDLLASPTTSEIAAAQQALLNAENTLQSAKDALTNAQNNVERAEDDLDAAEEELDVTHDALDSAHDALDDAYDACPGPGKPSFPSMPSQGNTASPAPTLTLAMCADDSNLYSAYTGAASQYNSARTAYNSAIGTVEAAESGVDAAESTQGSGNLERSIQSAELGLQEANSSLGETLAGPTSQEIDAARSSLESAQAGLRSAEERYNELFEPATAEEILPLQANVEQANANLESARKALEEATLVAPFDGVIGQVNIETGGQVSAGSTTAAFVLLNPNLLSIEANVDQADISDLAVGQPASVTFDALPDNTYEAKVSAIGLSPTVTQGVVTYAVTLTLDTSALLPDTPLPAPGMTASITITISSLEDVLVVPSQAVTRTGGLATVTVRTENGDEERQVTTGVTSGSQIQILSGLEEGDEVLLPDSVTTSGDQTETQDPFPQGFPGGGGAGGGGGFGGGGFPVPGP